MRSPLGDHVIGSRGKTCVSLRRERFMCEREAGPDLCPGTRRAPASSIRGLFTRPRSVFLRYTR